MSCICIVFVNNFAKEIENLDTKRKSNIGYLFETAEYPKGGWTFGVAGTILGILLEVVPFISAYNIVAHVLENSSTPQNLKSEIFWFWGIFALICICFSIASTLLGGYFAHKASFKLIRKLREKMLVHIGKLPMGYFTSSTSGNIHKVFDDSMSKIETVLTHAIPNLVGALPHYVLTGFFYSPIVPLFSLEELKTLKENHCVLCRNGVDGRICNPCWHTTIPAILCCCISYLFYPPAL